MNRHFHFLLFVAAVFATPLFLGCNRSEQPTAQQLTPQPDESVAKVQETQARLPVGKVAATSVTASKPTIEVSPAQPKSVLPSKDAAPNSVCETFLNLLKNGNRVAAENLLTRTALAVTSRAKLELEPIGSASAKYELGEPMYATNKQKLAHVECRVKDRVDGENIDSELVWMLRRQKEGWRISGILIQLEADKPKDLLSFENISDVVKIKNSLGSENTPETRQARVDDSDVR